MKISRKHRISVDLDNRNQLNLLKAYYNMKQLTEFVYVYETRKGYHIQGFFKDRTVEENMDARRLLGDDIARIELDENRIVAGLDYLTETLFVFGKEVMGIKSIEEPFNILSEQFWGFRI